MSTHDVTHSAHPTLVAGTADTVNFVGVQVTQLEVINDSETSGLYVNVDPDGVAATVGGDDTIYVPPASTLVRVIPPTSTISVISAGAAGYHVEALA